MHKTGHWLETEPAGAGKRTRSRLGVSVSNRLPRSASLLSETCVCGDFDTISSKNLEEKAVQSSSGMTPEFGFPAAVEKWQSHMVQMVDATDKMIHPSF